jgi:hypothetical protein
MKRALCALALVLLGAAPSRAQHVLLVQVGKLQLPVRAARRLIPQVEIDGRLQPVAITAPMLLHEADAYRDGFITAEDFEIAIRMTGFAPYRPDLQIDGFLTSTTDLQDCYILVRWQGGSPDSFTFTTGQLPDLKAGKRTTIQVWYPIGFNPNYLHPGQGYWAYIFSGKRECLTSLIAGKTPPKRWRQQGFVLRQTSYRSAAAFFNPVPEDLSLLPPTRPGSAVVEFRINADGDVVDPNVSSASRPEFGDLALSTVRQWLYAPAVYDHHFVEAPGKLLFIFPAQPTRSIPTLQEYLQLFTKFFGASLIDLDSRDGLDRLAGRYRNMSFDQALAELKGRVNAGDPSVVVGEISRLSTRRIYVQADIRYEADDGVAYKGSLRLHLVYSSDGTFKTATLFSPAYSKQQPVEIQPL